VALIRPDSATYRLAGLLPDPTLRSLDALHIASALDAEVDCFVSYDERQRAAATRAGLATMAPGSSSGGCGGEQSQASLTARGTSATR
jgi:hypothetical protein